jgi:Co/Zn/Cd efflux system component
LNATGRILLDREGPEHISMKIRENIEADQDSKVADLHLWPIGPDIYAVVMAVVAHQPATPDEYKARIPKHLGIAHISIEIHQKTTSMTIPRIGSAIP